MLGFTVDEDAGKSCLHIPEDGDGGILVRVLASTVSVPSETRRHIWINSLRALRSATVHMQVAVYDEQSTSRCWMRSIVIKNEAFDVSNSNYHAYQQPVQTWTPGRQALTEQDEG